MRKAGQWWRRLRECKGRRSRQVAVLEQGKQPTSRCGSCPAGDSQCSVVRQKKWGGSGELSPCNLAGAVG